jgi:RNA polymerase sigma-70 factor, ECF subfamily
MDLIQSMLRRDAGADAVPAVMERQDDLYRSAAIELGPAMARLAAAYERNPALREDLLQDIHLAVWQSLANFKGECSLRTWTYRVAHNTAATHVLRQKRTRREQWVTLEELENMPDESDSERFVDGWGVFEKLGTIMQKLKTIDRDILLLYLEGLEAFEIAEVVGVSPNLVAQKVRRTKQVLQRYFASGESHADK